MKQQDPKKNDAPPLLIFSAVNSLMAALEPIAKEHRNDEGDFWFRKIDEMCSTLQPLFVEHKLIAVPEVLEHTRHEHPVITAEGNRYVQFFTTVRVSWKIYCTIDGSCFPFPCVTMGEGMSDMHFSTNSAQTMAFKQMLVQLFCIPVAGPDPEEITGPRVGTSYQIPESTAYGEQSDAQPGERSLFDEDFTPPEERVHIPGVDETTQSGRARRSPRGRREKEPQTAVAGAGVAGTLEQALDTPLPLVTQGAPITAGFVKIIRSTLAAKGVDEEGLLAHIGSDSVEAIRTDQMEAAMAFINNGGGN